MNETMPIEPFQLWLRKKLEDRYETVTNMSECLGLPSKRLDSYLTGIKPDKRIKDIAIKEIDILEADRIMCLAGDHISEIYPDYYEL